MQRCKSDQVTCLFKIHHWLFMTFRRNPRLLSVTMKDPVGMGSLFLASLLTDLCSHSPSATHTKPRASHFSRRFMILKLLATVAAIWGPTWGWSISFSGAYTHSCQVVLVAGKRTQFLHRDPSTGCLSVLDNMAAGLPPSKQSEREKRKKRGMEELSRSHPFEDLASEVT